MPTDHPDGTRSIVISRADIQTPIDIQHQTTNVKTRIQESAINVPTKIAESAINIPTKIAESAINVPTKFVEQAANMETDFKAQSVGVYAQPEWATKEGIQKSDSIFGDEIAEEGSPYSDYTVTTGKTLYITQLSGMLVPSPPVDVPDIDPMAVGITDITASIEYFRVGGDGGCGMALPSPIKIPGGHTVRLYAYNCAPYTVSIISAWWVGYEI